MIEGPTTTEYVAVFDNGQTTRQGPIRGSLSSALISKLPNHEEFSGDLVGVQSREVTDWRNVPLSQLKDHIK